MPTTSSSITGGSSTALNRRVDPTSTSSSSTPTAPSAPSSTSPEGRNDPATPTTSPGPTSTTSPTLPGNETDSEATEVVLPNPSSSTQALTIYSAVIGGTAPQPSSTKNTFWAQCSMQATEEPKKSYKYNGSDAQCSFNSPPDRNNVGPAAAAGVLAVLFVAALAGLVFMWILYRRLKKRAKAEAEYANYTNGDLHHPQIPELQGRTAELTATLQSREVQLEALRGSLLNPQDPSPNALDDNTVTARFARVDQDIKDWVINNFRGGGSGEKRVVIGQELREMLIAQVPMFDRLLQQPKTKTLVLRAVVASVLQRAFETGEFLGVGTGLEVLGGTVEANTSPQEFNKWRSQTFQLLSRSAPPSSKQQAISTLTQYIDGLLAPFLTPADSSPPPISPQERLQSLALTIEYFASLSTDLSSQPARFKIVLDKPETPFLPETMDDVYQTNETRVDPNTGAAVNALSGKPILAVVFPSVVKWGNELGEGYDVASVIVKARVLT